MQDFDIYKAVRQFLYKRYLTNLSPFFSNCERPLIQIAAFVSEFRQL